jgi:uracil-DNA glycosylase
LDADENCSELEVLFVHNYSTDALALPEDRRGEAPSEQLLQRMIKAMKMPEGSYESLVIDEERDLFINKLSKTKVNIVVPMGAIATNLVLGKQERISKIHGKFYSKNLEYQNGQVRSFQVVPVFNPEMILINPNMKRSTWLDLQKIMEKLGIPTT